ncbi:hypothetical protein SKAU_G00225530, partial [Synaphobranchus kaupii]
DTIRVRVSRVRDNENGTGHREVASREGIQGRGRGGQVRGRGPGRAKGDLTQQGGRGGKKEEIINEVTESNEDTRRKGFTRSKGATGSNGDTRSNEGTIRKGDTRSKGDTGSNDATGSKGDTGSNGTTGKGETREKGPDTVGDFLQLLRSLRIKLPVDITSQKVIEISKAEQSVKDAETIIKDLEDFKLAFKSCPRLACRQVKQALALKVDGNVLYLTRLIFFEKKENEKEERCKQREANTSNTSRGFKLRGKYMKTPISTPGMYSIATTRSWEPVEVGTNSPRVTEGTQVKTKVIESRKFADESSLWNGDNCAKKFGMNDADEAESLKFFLGLQEVISDYKHASYTKGNNVEYGFLTGILDFLVVVRNKRDKQGVSKRLVIECKSTTGDMVDKLYTKTPNQKACVEKSHMYSIQLQTYLYILDKLAKMEKCPPDTRAMMILRHYHVDCKPPRDFHWSYLQTDEELQAQIDSLRDFCQEVVLGCFLAVLNLIFQKEN